MQNNSKLWWQSFNKTDTKTRLLKNTKRYIITFRKLAVLEVVVGVVAVFEVVVEVMTVFEVVVGVMAVCK